MNLYETANTLKLTDHQLTQYTLFSPYLEVSFVGCNWSKQYHVASDVTDRCALLTR